jgi:outer membrane protein OmpA-like peptidoglycan-associated protein
MAAVPVSGSFRDFIASEPATDRVGYGFAEQPHINPKSSLVFPPVSNGRVTRMRLPGISLALLLSTATAAAAQSAGSFDITGFGRYTRLDNTLRIQEEAGGGGSLSFFPLANVAVEGEGAFTQTHSNITRNPITNITLRGRLSYNLPIGGYSSSLRLGAGYVRNLYRKDIDFDDNGFTGIFGVRVGFTENLGLRLDGTADYVRSPEGGRVDKYVNWGMQAGLSLLFGKSADGDKDGVLNPGDRCPGSPRGKSVDGSGCAASQLDADKDRVNDDLDRCPNTTTGESVDPNGCSAGQTDADHDGISDAGDRCPGTSAGERADSEGCAPSQKDDDKDGVMNASDRCPDTRPGEPVDAAGCPPGPRDSDGDKVVDTADQCPNTPAGEQVNVRGCPRDMDTDGVSDARDHCPSTPVGQPIDANGCPILFQKGARTVVLRGVTFQTGKATLTPAARAVLRDIATQLVENPEYRVQISGHTDNTGSRAANLRLSLARARTVETFLEANGVPARQVMSKGFGPDVQIAPNTTAAGRAQNRRVELNRTN